MMKYKLKDLIEYNTSTELKSGEWVPARSCNSRQQGKWSRFKEAIAVFKGQADTFTWPEDDVKWGRK